jgi:hypothetical protein
MRKQVSFYLVTAITALSLFSCKKKEIIDAIPQHCFDASFANFSVDNQLQIISDNSIDGVNLNYFFGAKPNGEWSVSLESDDFLLSINHEQLISFDEYLLMTRKEFLQWLASNDNIDLVTSNQVSNLLFQDFSSNELFIRDDLASGLAKMKYLEANNCAFIEVDYELRFQKNSSEKIVTGVLKSAVVPKS